MSRQRSRRTVLRGLGASTVVALAGCPAGGSGSEDVEDYRETLSQYTDVGRAGEDGYSLSFPYVETDAGVLGIPFVRYDAPELEPAEPNALFYDLREDGTFELLGAKWFVRTSEAEEPPTLFGEEFGGPRAGETYDIPEHYGLHAWLFEDNPEGLFAEYHADVEPPSYIDELQTAWDELTPYHSNEQLALDEGYVDNDEDCVSTDGGDYGVPLVHTDRTGTDLAEPGALLYRFGSNWSYNLQGAEWYVPADATDEPPTLFGQEFHEPLPGHSSAFAEGEHYGLHAWLFSANPDGMFARYRPDSIC